ncbi:MAG TPA: tol-pal system protein YbgF [Candidatus Kapabacteria bacterium]|nr:tol-pal system protein YbgF [Candidatus Kapabacteria bacterium]
MKQYIIISLVVASILSTPLYPAKKDKVLLDEIQNLATIVTSLEEKINTITDQTAFVYKKIEIIDEKVSAIAKNQADYNQDKENLQLSLQFIKEELNELKNSIGKINDRLTAMPVAAAPAGMENPGVTPEAGSAQSPESIYYTAYSDYIKKNYDLAIEGFKQFIRLYPNNGLADNSLYWIGECYYSQKKYQEAVATFKELKTNYSDGDKVPDAILKEGFALIEMGKQTEGNEVLKEVISKFPLSEEASLAQQKIKEVSE